MLDISKLKTLQSLLREYVADSRSCGFPSTADEAGNLLDTVSEEIHDAENGPMGEDSEPDFNAESGRERHVKEYQEKYR